MPISQNCDRNGISLSAIREQVNFESGSSFPATEISFEQMIENSNITHFSANPYYSVPRSALANYPVALGEYASYDFQPFVFLYVQSDLIINPDTSYYYRLYVKLRGYPNSTNCRIADITTIENGRFATYNIIGTYRRINRLTNQVINFAIPRGPYTIGNGTIEVNISITATSFSYLTDGVTPTFLYTPVQVRPIDVTDNLNLNVFA